MSSVKEVGVEVAGDRVAICVLNELGEEYQGMKDELKARRKVEHLQTEGRNLMKRRRKESAKSSASMYTTTGSRKGTDEFTIEDLLIQLSIHYSPQYVSVK